MHEVHWLKKATTDLAAICLDHLTMWPIIDAAEQDIARKLQRHPLKYSQEVSEGLRRIISWPLIVYFSIEGNKVAVRTRWQGTHRGELQGIPPTGKHVDFQLMEIMRIQDGKIAEGWVVFDSLGMLQQIGAAPQPKGAAV